MACQGHLLNGILRLEVNLQLFMKNVYGFWYFLFNIHRRKFNI